MPKSADLTTFADLGIAFPLFEAPVRYCAAHVGPATCDRCHLDLNYFTQLSDIFWIGPCPDCGTVNRRAFEKRVAGEFKLVWDCVACEAKLTDQILEWTKEEHLVCFRCAQEQGVEFSKDTEFGLVDSDAVELGVTGGVPGLTDADGFELVVVNENWNDTDIAQYRVVSAGVRIAPELLRDLLRTPLFCGWQQEKWLFCCRRPMIYMGHWLDVVQMRQPKDRAELFRTIYETAYTVDTTPQDDWLTASLDFEATDPEMYVFRCPECERLRCYID